jgi:hypothetical protein
MKKMSASDDAGFKLVAWQPLRERVTAVQGWLSNGSVRRGLTTTEKRIYDAHSLLAIYRLKHARSAHGGERHHALRIARGSVCWRRELTNSSAFGVSGEMWF